MKRAAFIALFAACYTSKPAPQTGGGSSSGSATSSGTSGGGPADYPPAAFKPPTSGLAVGIAQFLVIDDAHERVFVRRDKGIDVLALDSGAKKARIDLGWEGELYPAQPNVLAMQIVSPKIEIALVDPVATKTIATCSATPTLPAGAVILRVDEFTTHAGTTYLHWESSPPPRFHGGAAMSDEEIQSEAKDFRAAYACGLFALKLDGGRCTLTPATFKDAGLESCETRMMPWPRYLPTPIGSLSLSTERSSAQRAGLMIDIETFIVSESGKERWRLPIETRATPPPPP